MNDCINVCDILYLTHKYTNTYTHIYREIAQYLCSRKHLGLTRSVDYFEFARAFAAIR